MKQLISFVVLLFLSLSGFAQMPKAINYQAVARNSTGQLLANQAIQVRLSIVTNAPGNPALYSETRNVTTNSLGLFNLQIGTPGALSTSGDFTTINWTNNTSATKSLKAEIDFSNSGIFTDMGMQSLVSVPYAFSCDEALNTYNIGGNYVSSSTPASGDFLRWDGSSWYPTPVVANGADSQWARNGQHVYNNNGTGYVGIGTSNPLTLLHVKDSSVLFEGPDDPFLMSITPPPAQGAGTRMMWYAQKGAFRVGTVQNGEWTMGNIGINSFAAGFRPVASGQVSTAIGSDALAIGNFSTAIGYGVEATGGVSTAFGNQTHATGSVSTALGMLSTASGAYSVTIGKNTISSGENAFSSGANTIASGESATAMGFGGDAQGKRSTAMGSITTANGYASLVIGQFNDPIVSPETSITTTTPLFIVGNGSSSVSKSNAMVVRKDGRVGVGTNAPGGQFELSLDQGRKPSTSTWTITSDARLKNIEGSYTKGLKEILQLKPIQYHYKNTEKRKFSEDVLQNQCVGFSAQDVQKIFPECVGTDEDGYLNLNTHAILIAYTNALKELNATNEQLASENQTQQRMISELSNRILALEKK